MARGKASGYSLKADDVPIVLGMLKRGDRDHDIAAWFGVNQGRVADAKDGKFGTPSVAAGLSLPPAGPPGIKGRRLRSAVNEAISLLSSGKHPDALQYLQDAIKLFDQNEA